MKLQSNVYHVDKQSCLEEGSRAYETTNEDCNDNRKSRRCRRCLQLMNLILCLELILFIGWMGGVFITNYYQAQDLSGLDQQHGASEWSWDPERFDHATELSPVLSGTATTNNETPESATANKNVNGDTATTTAMNGSASDDTSSAVASILPWLWLQSLTGLENAWTDDSSESTISKIESHWGGNETGSSNGSDSPVIDQDDKMEFALPFWHTIDFTFNNLDKRLDSDGDLVQADGIPNTIIVLETIDLPGRHRSRRTRSTSTPNQESSLSFLSEESISIYSESLPANSEATSSEEDAIQYVGKNLVDWLDEEGV